MFRLNRVDTILALGILFLSIGFKYGKIGPVKLQVFILEIQTPQKNEQFSF
jgi:hypothetical protein